MKRELHPNKKWLTPIEAERYTGHRYASFRRWASAGLVQCKENPAKKTRGSWLYRREDIDKNILKTS